MKDESINKKIEKHHHKIMKNNKEKLPLDLINSNIGFIKNDFIERPTIVSIKFQTTNYIRLRSYKSFFLNVLDNDPYSV